MISLVLPAFNPGSAIATTWRAIQEFLASSAAQTDRWEVVFVLDGCSDGTFEKLTALIRGHELTARIVSYSQNRGKGFAVRTGLLAARGNIRIFTDVDLAYSLDDVLRVAGAIKAGASVAIGSRTHPESRVQLPMSYLGYAFRRALQGRLFGSIARLLLPISTLDTQAGLKGMTAAVVETVMPHLSCDGFGFDCEFLTVCANSGIRLAEVPVCVRYTDATSTTGARSGLRMFRELLSIRRNWRGKLVPLATFPTQDVTRPHSSAAA